MPPEESRYPKDWLSIAERDWRRIDQALNETGGYYLLERYPLIDSSPLTLEEVTRSQREITGLVELIRRELL